MKTLQESLLDVNNTVSNTEQLFDIEAAIQKFGNSEYFGSSAIFDICNNWHNKKLRDKDAKFLIDSYFYDYDDDFNVFVRDTRPARVEKAMIPFQTIKSLLQYIIDNINVNFISFADDQDTFKKISGMVRDDINAHYTYTKNQSKEIKIISNVFATEVKQMVLKSEYVKAQDYLDEGLFYVAYSDTKRCKLLDCIFAKIFEDGEGNPRIEASLNK